MTVIAVLMVLSFVIPFGALMISSDKKRNAKKAFITNAVSFFGVLTVATVLIFNGTVSAEAAETAVKGYESMAFLAAALSTGLSSIGAGIAVSAAASAALGAISENEGIMGKALIFVALAEGIALYGLLVSFTILGNV
ncbi:MAG: ATP synthase subunit C [Clostridia bacterium]